MTEVRENDRLLKAMKKLARVRDERSRKALYSALLRANLYIPIQAVGDDATETAFLQAEPLQGQPVYVAFTSAQAIGTWRPGHLQHTQMSGMDLFPLLDSCKAASLLINPGGDMRGELYRNEIATLSEAVPRYKAWLAQLEAL